MISNPTEGSVGIVETKSYSFNGELELESGRNFGPIDIAYETYGELNEEGNNAILICHALSGDAHAAGWHEGDEKPGWWDNTIGPGKTFDTNKYFVICSNVLGGCKGTTGPPSINEETGEPYGTDFPVVTINDMVKAQKVLIDYLGIKRLLAVAGGSLGGMQALQWAVSYPDKVKFCIPIATTAHSSPQQIAFNEVRRRAVMSDPNWNNGDYYGKEPPKKGLSLARMIGHILFLSEESMYQKFGRKLRNKKNYGFDLDIDFEVESYLHYKGDSFVERFDANSYLYITRAIDYFDLTQGGDKTLPEAFQNVSAKFLVVGISSDWLYPPYQSREIAQALETNNVDVTYSEITSSYGHDAFLVEPRQLKHMVTNFLSRITVQDIYQTDVPLIRKDSSIEKSSQLMMETEFTHIPVVDKQGKLEGIITAWDIAKAIAKDLKTLKEIMTENVVTTNPNESIEDVTQKIQKHNISALPVTNEKNRVLGIVTSETITRLVGKNKPIPGTKEPDLEDR